MRYRILGFAATLCLALVSTFACADQLTRALASQPDEVQARYDSRHPAHTLGFFGIKPGMTVVEAFPGGGWYSKILLAFLGDKGRLIGADYAYAMYPKFNFYDDAYLEKKKSWLTTWPKDAIGWRGTSGPAVDAFLLGSMPTSLDGTADAVLFIRALHNLLRFENDGGYLSAALGEANRVLKPGGIVGVVQHKAPESASDEWAGGSNGYVKQSVIVERFKAAGFEFVGAIEVNLNPLDKPNEKDFVWRLPPSLASSKNDPELAATYREIGESTRMTLLFKKP